MKLSGRQLSMILMVSLVILTLYEAVYYGDIPDKILRLIEASNNTNLEKAGTVTFTLLIITLAQLILLLLSIYILVTGSLFERKENIVYIERASSKDDEETVDGAEEVYFSEGVEDKLLSILKEEDIDGNRLDFFFRELANELKIVIGAFYKTTIAEDRGRYIEFVSGYAFQLPDSKKLVYEFGEGIAGQVAKSKEMMRVDGLPPNYLKVVSGLGAASPSFLLAFPIFNEKNELMGVLEVASFQKFPEKVILVLQNLCEKNLSYLIT